MNINNKLAIMLIIGLKNQTKIILLLEISSFFGDNFNIKHNMIALIEEYNRTNSINDNIVDEKISLDNIS
jgi:hypothetical protein